MMHIGKRDIVDFVVGSTSSPLLRSKMGEEEIKFAF
jgi:hypothetical protein